MKQAPIGDGEAAKVLQALRQSGAVDRHEEILDLEITPFGVGALADTYRVVLHRSVGEPLSVIAKMPSKNPAAASVAASLGAYEREARFYLELTPKTKVRVPRLLGVIGADDVPNAVLLEDLSQSHVPGDQFAELAAASLEQARHQLALLQAPFWNDAPTSRLPWLHRRLGVPIPHIVERMQRSWSIARETIGADLARDERACVDRFVAKAGAWAGGIRGPCSLVHHDYRVDNMLFGNGEVVILDWQTVGWGPPMFDLAYLLGTSLEPMTRRLTEREIVRRHVDDLAEQGVAWSVEEAWESYRAAAFAVLLMLVPPIATVKSNPRMEAMYRRLIAFGSRMVLDLNALEFLPQ